MTEENMNPITKTAYAAKAESNTYSRHGHPFILITLSIFFVLLTGFIVFTVLYPDWTSSISIKQTESVSRHLVDTKPQAGNSMSQTRIISWLIILVAGFAALQILPVIAAANKSKKKLLTQKVIKEITFLCETPMYFGLLGSLLGICLTQFMTSSLSAPLAYITTITGILIYLFAKFTIIVPLPDNSTDGIVEEAESL